MIPRDDNYGHIRKLINTGHILGLFSVRPSDATSHYFQAKDVFLQKVAEMFSKEIISIFNKYPFPYISQVAPRSRTVTVLGEKFLNLISITRFSLPVERNLYL